jgi:DNA-binding MarR family transcriptional regulator
MERSNIMSAIAEDMAYMRRFAASAHKACDMPKGLPTRAQIGILFTLEHQGPLSLKDLSHELSMSPSAATQLIDGLARDKLLVREEDAQDRRKVRLSLTADGHAKLIEAKKAHIASFMKLFQALDDTELLQYRDLQRKLISHLK